MRLIFGIGNPGSRYQYNRHNIGFMFLDYLVNKYSLTFSPSKFDYYFAEGNFADQDFSLIKPTTYVNNSGVAAVQAIQNYKIQSSDFLLVYDDINLDFPGFRIRVSGSDGGHNGVNSIIYHLESEKFPRIRFGIGNNFEKGKMVEYVLTDFNNDEMKEIEKTFEDIEPIVSEFIKGGEKYLLDANSKFLKNQNFTNQSKGNQESL